jgi:hypothetical protein
MSRLRPLSSPDRLADEFLWTTVIRAARCADSNLDADQWFPVSIEAEGARREAAAAIAICEACPVRVSCLQFSLRQWDVGQHGVWGGLVAGERATLRRLMLAGVTSIIREGANEGADPEHGASARTGPVRRARKIRHG